MILQSWNHLAKGQLDTLFELHMPILIFSPVQIIMGHPLPVQYENSIVTSIQYEIKLFCIKCTIKAMIIYLPE